MFHKTILTTIMSLMILAAVPVLGGVKRVTVHVDGLACPFCTYNLEKRIKTLEGASNDLNWEASVDNGTASFNWNPEVEFSEDAVREQIRKAGFTPRKVVVEETDDRDLGFAGTVTLTRAADDKALLQLTLKNGGDPLTLVAADRIDRAESFKMLMESMTFRAVDVSAATRKVAITAFGEKATDDPAVLVLHSWKPAEYGAEVILNIDTLTCENCSAGVVQTIREVEGVIHVEANFDQDRVRVWTNSQSPETKMLTKAVEQAGFKVTHAHIERARHAEGTTRKDG